MAAAEKPRTVSCSSLADIAVEARERGGTSSCVGEVFALAERYPCTYTIERNIRMSKTWFITGASKGFGREWTEAALERGDTVAGTARKLETLDALVEKYSEAFLPIRLDVTDRDADFAAVQKAAEHFGQLDIVINNAGYGHFGMIEELTEDEARAQLETNLFGALWIT